MTLMLGAMRPDKPRKPVSRKKANAFLVAGGVITALMAVFIVLGYFWTPYSTTGMSREKFLSPCLRHPLGTDNLGRDLLSRIMEGAGSTFLIALCVVLIGGIVEGYDTNGRNGEGGYFVCEADESDGSFLYLNPDVVVVTNIEADHLDHYGTLENIEKTFCQFMDLVGDEGCVIINGDDPHYPELARSTGRRVLTYGFDESCDYVCTPHAGGHALESHFAVRLPSGETVELSLGANPGRHNMANATAALAVADVLGCDAARAGEALSSFKGAHRRFTHVGDIDGITVVDDYGHHPTEIQATLAAARGLDFKRIVCAFQPHRYSRTQSLADQFAHAFDDADVLVVTEVFSAGETPIPGVTGKVVASKVEEAGGVADVSFVAKRKDLVQHLVDVCRPGDLLITQGAGDITAIGPMFIEAKRELDEGEEA